MPPKTKTAQPEPIAKEDNRLPFFKVSRRVLLAAVGAASLAQDEIEEFINRLVERGEIAEKDGRKLMEEVLQRRKMKRQKIKDEVSKRISAAFTHMDIPTRKDVEMLNEKISTLTQKIETLKKGE